MSRPKLLNKKSNLTLTVSDLTRQRLRFISSYRNVSISELLEAYSLKELRSIEREQGTKISFSDTSLDI